MKNRIYSLLLIFSLLLSMFATYSFASEPAVTAENSNMVSPYVHYRNSFGDGFDDTSTVFTLSNAKNSYLEMRAESNGNKYGYLYFNDRNGVDGSNGNVYFQINPQKAYTVGTDKMGYLILEMDFNDFGADVTTSKFFEVHSGEGALAADQRVAASDILNIGNDSKGNFFYSGSKVGYTTKKVYIPSNEWVHIRLEFSVLDESATKYSLKCYIGDDDTVDFDLS